MGIGRAAAHAVRCLICREAIFKWCFSGSFWSLSNDLLGGFIDKAGSDSFIKTKGLLITGAVSGGVGSVLGGGNFWMVWARVNCNCF
jgi:hypothetical protein